jgi:P pilus assembly chaperone PapD
MKKLLALMLFVMSGAVQAGVVIYGTRVIYPADKKEVVVQIMNQGERTSLVQAWIDDGDTAQSPEHIDVPFLLTPPVSRVAAKSGQQLKIKKMNGNLPPDVESLFFLNVLDIPPNDEQSAGKNVIKFATQNRIKLFWRPAGIAPVNKDSFRHLQLSRTAQGIIIKNNNANWITITEVSGNNQKINKESLMLAPRTQQAIPSEIKNVSVLTMTMIDDYGNYLTEKITIN